MSLRVGSFVFATTQGLGLLAKSFYDAGVVTDVMVIRHGRREEHTHEWYPNAPVIGDLRRQGRLMDRFAHDMDVMLFFETPFRWEVIPFCRERAIPTVLMPMYECMPVNLPYVPDRYICPSLLDLEYYPDNSVFIPVPVAGVPWRLREKATTFIHNAGNGGMLGRNGTSELIEAMKLVSSGARLTIRSQEKLGGKLSSNVKVEIGTFPYQELFKEGDVFVFPEKFNGLSLPLQEAYASGMLVMCGKRFPMTEWLPNDPLIPVAKHKKNRIPSRYGLNEFDEALIEPKDIAATIDHWYGRDIGSYSLQGKQWAEEHSWEALKPKYMEVLSQ